MVYFGLQKPFHKLYSKIKFGQTDETIRKQIFFAFTYCIHFADELTLSFFIEFLDNFDAFLEQDSRAKRLNSTIHHISNVSVGALYKLYLEKRVADSVQEYGVFLSMIQAKVHLLRRSSLHLITLNHRNHRRCGPHLLLQPLC